MANAMDVANYFLATLGAEDESDITNLKLQKLCAYAQGLSLALLNAPLFPDEIEAWTHGPVIPEVYNNFVSYGRNTIPESGLSESHARLPFQDDQKFILELTKSYYGSYAAWELRNRSHYDFPGIFGSRMAIPKAEIAQKFSKLPIVRKFLDHIPPENESGKTLSNEEFWDAFQV